MLPNQTARLLVVWKSITPLWVFTFYPVYFFCDMRGKVLLLYGFRPYLKLLFIASKLVLGDRVIECIYNYLTTLLSSLLPCRLFIGLPPWYHDIGNNARHFLKKVLSTPVKILKNVLYFLQYRGFLCHFKCHFMPLQVSCIIMAVYNGGAI